MHDESPLSQQEAKDLEELIAALRNEDGDIRAMAAQELGRQRARQAVEPFLEALNDPDYWRVRCNAAEALGKIGDVRAVDPLIASLKHLDLNTQVAAAEALGNLGDPRAIEALSAQMRMGTDRIFKANAEALEKLGGSTIVMAEQTVREKRVKREEKRVKSVKMMRRGGILIVGSLSVNGLILKVFDSIVTPSDASNLVLGLIVLILVCLVLIGALMLVIGFVRWLMFNLP